jgi:hypothetical protein
VRLSRFERDLPGWLVAKLESAIRGQGPWSPAGDTPVDWLRAGQALRRVLLRAGSQWVFASLHTQPWEA